MLNSMKKGKNGIWIAIISILILLALSEGVWIYSLKDRINSHEAETNSLKKDITELNMEINDLKNPKSGVSYNGWLSLEENRLVNAHGELIQLRGVSSHGIMWYPEFGNYRAIATTKEYGANVFRVAMYTTENNGYDENPKESARTLKAVVENTLGADMYAIVDWHVLREENPNVYVEEAIQFFDEISKMYADEPGVIYEICNEPNGDTSWNDIKSYAQRVIPVIRKNSPNALILVGTPKYCVNIDEAADDPLSYDNIMYTFHYYARSDEGGYKKRISYALEKGCAVFVSEWGIGGSIASEDMDAILEEAGSFVDFLDENNISWISWALSNKNETHSLITPGSLRLSHWGTDDSLTPYGKFVFSRLKRPAGEE